MHIDFLGWQGGFVIQGSLESRAGPRPSHGSRKRASKERIQFYTPKTRDFLERLHALDSLEGFGV